MCVYGRAFACLNYIYAYEGVKEERKDRASRSDEASHVYVRALCCVRLCVRGICLRVSVLRERVSIVLCIGERVSLG